MTLRVRFGDVEHGSLPVSLEEDEQHLTFFASSILYSSLDELVSALLMLFNPRTSTTVKWFTEPIEYEFNFLGRDDLVALEVVEFPDSRRSDGCGHVVFLASGLRTQLVLPFWRALRSLETRPSFEQQWGRAISGRDMRLLEQQLRVN